MKIIGEIEANNIPKVGDTLRKMKLTQMGSEVVAIIIPAKEMEWMKNDFYQLVKQRKLMWKNKEELERSELFHMIGIALRNAKKSDCLWFKEAAMGISQDAEEFDQHSIKSLIFNKKEVYILIAYNGKQVGGLGREDTTKLVRG
jgi:hypothetical protein